MRLAMISPFPDKERKQLMKMSAVAQYTNTLLQNVLAASDGDIKVTVLTEILTQPERYEEKLNGENVIDVQRCYTKSRFCFLSLLRKLYAGNFDFIHIQNETFLFGGIYSLFMFPLFVAASRVRATTAVTLHHVIPKNQIKKAFAEIHQTRMPLWIIRLGFTVIYRSIGMASNAIVVHEEYFRDVLIHDYNVNPSKISVIFHGVTEKTMETIPDRAALMQEFGVPSDTGTIFGFFGYISKFKGIDVLIHEFKKHLKVFPNSTLVITGALHPRIANDPVYLNYIDSLKRSAAECNGRIIWFGPISALQIQHFYKMADCIVLPYQQTNSTSSVVSDGIGYRTPLLVSEFLKPTLSNPDLIFTLQEGDLSRKMTEFNQKSDAERASLQAYLDGLRNERLWSLIGGKTYRFYRKKSGSAGRKNRDVFVIGAYGQSNLGDECLLVSAMELFGRDRCIVLSADPLATAQEHEVPAVSHLHCLGAFLNCTTIAVGGGDQFKLLKKSTGRNRYALLFEITLLTIVARIWRKKLLLLGIGIGNVSTGPARFLTRFCLKRADALSLRDKRSYEIAVELTARTDISYAADLTFLHPEKDRVPARNGMTQLAMAPAFELEHPEEYERVMGEIAKAADGCMKTNPTLSVTLLPFQPDFHAHSDRKICNELYDRIAAKERCSIADDLSKNTVHGIYDQTDIVWGVRLHSLIFACMHAIPFIALIYDEKVRSFLKETGCEQWGIELDASFTAEKLTALHGNLMANLPAATAHLKEQKNILSERAQASRVIAGREHALPTSFFQSAPSPRSL